MTLLVGSLECAPASLTEPGRVLTGRRTGGDTGVMAVAAIAVPAAERGVLAALSALAAAAGRPTRARPARAVLRPARGVRKGLLRWPGPLKPIPASAPRARRALVQRLRSLKESSGNTCEALAKNCGLSDSVVRRALGGGHVPLWETVEKIAATCGRGGDLAGLWSAAKAEEIQPGASRLGPRMVTSRVEFVEFVEFVESMIFMRIDGGYPALHQLERRAGTDQDGRTRLPHSTLHLVLKKRMPPTEVLFVAFMEALEVPVSKRPAWMEAHRRVFADAPVRRPFGVPPPVVLDEPAPVNSCQAAERALSRIEVAENIKTETGQLREPDDYDLLGLGYLNTPVPGRQGPELYDDEELAAREADAPGGPRAHEIGGLREDSRAVLRRTQAPETPGGAALAPT
ncbi:helix-turn-helix domain-containing protein [Streptomyces sp. PT19]|uniref:helix-turn-helix domain-containing protein n=1 Tax=Streptomyces sp. PT19 TaxID=3452239 RepID=UPI003F7FF525